MSQNVLNKENHVLKQHSGAGALVAQSSPTLATPWTAAWQAPLPMGFSGRNTGAGRHCCYIILGTEFKGNILEQDELFCCALGLKKKKFVLFFSLRAADPFLLLGDPGLLTNPPRNRLSQLATVHGVTQV